MARGPGAGRGPHRSGRTAAPYAVTLAGRPLTVDPRHAHTPRVLSEGRELERDRWGSYVLRAADGRVHRVEVGFDWAQLGTTAAGPLAGSTGTEALQA
ncbi:hypothetical protein [Quadrisphaera sp. DSM 44207]|uniref:hypothetical protein n=1 Tax=Quadrisphaera sp. DSM 44207 TaxID=1881057 RepID=UPI00115F9334|nr:hypothetical protein [Quadrisphaera sp. DSM 44207]